MLKKTIFGVSFGVLCLGLIAVVIVKRLKDTNPTEVLQAVPEDAIVFIENLDYEYISEGFVPGNRIWIDFVNTTGRTGLDSLVHIVFSQVKLSEALHEVLMKEGLNISLHLVGKELLSPLFYIRFGDTHSDHDFTQMLTDLLEDRTMVNERRYETTTLYDVSGGPGFFPDKFSFAVLNGLCIISPSSLLVEESIRTIHADSDLSASRELLLVRETAGRFVQANIYINYKHLNQLFYPFIKESEWGSLTPLTLLASWGELDLDIKENAIILNGMTHADPETNLFMNLFSGQSPVKMEIHEVIPTGISYFMHMGISDPLQFMDSFNDYMMGAGEITAMEAEKGRIEEAYGMDPLADLVSVMDDEMAWFAMEGETSVRSDEILVIETKSRSETRDMVMVWVEQYLRNQSLEMRSVRNVYNLDSQTAFNIYHLPDHFYEGSMAGRLFNAYFTLYENYLIFGPSVDVLSRIIYQNVLHKTFASDPLFREMGDYLSNRSNVTLFLIPYAYLDYRKDHLESEAVEKLDAMELFLRRIPGIVVQFSAEEQLFYHSVSGRYNSQIKEKALTVWESLLDTAAVMKPQLVINHNTSEKEIFIQDAANRIYLINSTGRILWKQPLEGPIMGEIFQVDLYRNGKLQYLFNTREKIHLIDRNGNNVERYPISLRSGATNPMALFDYDKNRDYRIFLAGEDQKIYVYDMEGNVVTGWRFDRTESTVTGAVQHFAIDGSDYIVFKDDNRVYLTDRRGRERVRMKERVILSPNNPLYLDMNIREERPRWISTDTSGRVRAIYEDGTVSTLLENTAGPEHFFLVQDMDRDGVLEFIFADGDELTVLRQDGKRLFSSRVRDNISHMPDIYKFSASDIKIGITDMPRNKIYLVNSDGSLYEGFPLEGSTRFSIGYFAGSDSRFNLIVGSSNNFLYNYSIE